MNHCNIHKEENVTHTATLACLIAWESTLKVASWLPTPPRWRTSTRWREGGKEGGTGRPGSRVLERFLVL